MTRRSATHVDSPESLRERLRILGLEKTRLITLRDATTRDRNNAIKLGALGILSVPAFVLWGFWVALAVLVQAVLIVVGGWYITGVHVIEYTGNIRDCERDIAVVSEQLRTLQASAQRLAS